VLHSVLGPTGPFGTIALLALIGAEAILLRGAPPAPKQSPRLFRLLPFAYVPLQLVAIVWAMNKAARPQMPPVGFLALLFSIGVTTGVFGMLTAHELVHSKKRGEKILGAIMLTGMCYRHFRVAHIYGHHRHAGTRDDPSTARAGEGFYAFLWRTVPGQVVDAWRHEQRRSAMRGILANRVYGDLAIMSANLIAIFVLWG